MKEIFLSADIIRYNKTELVEKFCVVMCVALIKFGKESSLLIFTICFLLILPSEKGRIFS